MNLSLMAKLGWRICHEEHVLWAQVIARRHCRGDADNLLSYFKTYLLKPVERNSSKTLFWRDVWVGTKPLLEEALVPLSHIPHTDMLTPTRIRSKGGNGMRSQGSLRTTVFAASKAGSLAMRMETVIASVGGLPLMALSQWNRLTTYLLRWKMSR